MGGHQSPLDMERGGYVVISLQIMSSLGKKVGGSTAWESRKDGKESNRGNRGGGSTEVGGGPRNPPLTHLRLLNKAKNRSPDGNTGFPTN